MKKKSSVIAKLIIPVAVLGCIAIMIAGVSLYSMTAVQKESNQISGEGVRATICMDEILLLPTRRSLRLRSAQSRARICMSMWHPS